MIPNAPPVEVHGLNINDLYDEAKLYLDGSGITSETEAEGVSALLEKIRQARNAADDQRKVEKRPHDEAAKAVQEAWAPLLRKCDLAVSTCREALSPWLSKKEAEQRAAAKAAADEAEALRVSALRMAQDSAKSGDLETREQVAAALNDAKKAAQQAKKLDKAKPQVGGGSRATGLRTSYRAEVTDFTAFSRWAWANRRAEYEAFLADLAEREGRRGPVQIPGILIHTERKAA